MKTIFSSTLILLSTLASFSQISYEKRIELELEDGHVQERIDDFGKFGFVLSAKKEEVSNAKSEWKYALYNSSLELVETKSINLNYKFVREESYSNSERMHTLYKDRKGNYALISVEAKSFEINQIEGKLPKKTSVNDMAIMGDYAYFEGETKGSPLLFSVNWKTGEQRIIPVTISGIKPKLTSLLGFQIMGESNEVFLYVKALSSSKSSEIYIYRLNDKGELKNTYNFTKSIDKNITSISASKLDNEKYIFTGTYSTKSTSSSEGMFFCQVDHERMSFIEYYNFLDLENFLNYLPEKKQDKIEKKKQRKEDKGKEYAINYRIVPHDIIQLKDGYILLGEAYYPTYRTETYTQTTYINGVASTTTYTTTVFDGYQYTHAMMARFDMAGRLIWDQVFEMWQAYKPFYVKKFISIAEKHENSLKLAYASHNKIYTKSIDYSGAIISDFESDEIETSYSGDKTKKSASNLAFWYDNYFLSYGVQKIKNTEGNEVVKRKRKVYFISKIKFK